MKIYKIWQNVNNHHDTYDSAIVCAESEEEAKKYHPCGNFDYEETGWEKKEDSQFRQGDYLKRDSYLGSWVKKKYVKVEEIGTADESIKKGIIVASFNAG